MEQVREWARTICPYGAESSERHKLPAFLLLLSEIAIGIEAKDWIALDLIVSHARLAAFGESDQAIEAERALTAKWRKDAGITAEAIYQ